MNILRIPEGMSLYEARGFEFVEKLRIFAESLHRSVDSETKVVLLLQQAPADDRCSTWLTELRDKILLNELAERIDTLRWTLSLIRNSPIPWIYASKYDSFGSYWELSSACSRRFWFSTTARIGFPEIVNGAFPPGATLESLEKRIGKVRERWRERPVCFAWEAAREGLVDFCSDSDSYETDAIRFYNEYNALSSRAQRREFERKQGRKGYDFDSDLKARNATVARLTEVWREGETHQQSIARPETWDYCWQLVADKNMARNSHERGRVISFITSHHYLSETFQNWLAGGVARRKFAQQTEPSKKTKNVVFIDLNLGEPPAEALKRIFDSGKLVVFFCDDAHNLSQRLGQIFNKTSVTEEKWDRQVNWYQGSVKHSDELVLRYGQADKLTIRCGSMKLEFVRLEAGEHTVRLGTLEWLNVSPLLGEEAELCINMARIISNGIVQSRVVGRHAVPISTYIRSIFLEEIVRIASIYAGDVSRVLESLYSHGWTFAASENCWEAFLQTRADDHVFDGSLQKIDGRPFSKAIWESRSWRELRSTVKRLAKLDLSSQWSPAHQSQHLAIFLGILAMQIASFVDSIDTSDYLCGRALGFPSAYGTPTYFLRTHGRRRIEWYLERQWPEFKPQNLWTKLDEIQASHS